jgi:hypothetical protein
MAMRTGRVIAKESAAAGQFASRNWIDLFELPGLLE